MLTAQLGSSSLGFSLDDLNKIMAKGQAYLDQVTGIITKVDKYMDVVNDILDDPALPTVINQIRTIKKLQPSTTKVTTTSSTGVKQTVTVPTKGIGLQKVVKPIDAYIWYVQHKGTAIALGVAAVLVPMGAMFAVGRLSKRCRVAPGKSKPAASISGSGGSGTRRAGGRLRRRTIRS